MTNIFESVYDKDKVNEIQDYNPKHPSINISIFEPKENNVEMNE